MRFSILLLSTLILLGIFYFLSLSFNLPIFTVFPSTVFAIWILNKCTDPNPFVFKFGNWNELNKIEYFIFSIFFLLGTRQFVNFSTRWGGYDAWAIWTNHSIFIDSIETTQRLLSSELSWSHPDYPVVLPSLICVFNFLCGGFSAVSPMAVAFLIFLLFMLTSFFCLEPQGGFFGLSFCALLIIDDFFMSRLSSQYADSLLGLIELTSMILFSRVLIIPKIKTENICLLGFVSSFSVLIKNEGIIFLLILVFSLIYFLRRERHLIFYFILSLIPALSFLLVAKTVLFVPNEIIGGLDFQGVFSKLTDVHRYTTVAKYFFVTIWYKFYLGLFIFIFLLWFGSPSRVGKVLLTLVVLNGVAFFLIYILTPYELNWHLETSLDRLLHQIYPSYLFICFYTLHELITISSNSISIGKK
jgi:hypothetical protein